MNLFYSQIMLIMCAILLVLFILSFPNWKRNIALKRWRASLNLNLHEQTYHQLFNHVNGFHLSRQARMHNDALEYVYGEINFTSFIALLSYTKPTPNTIFYDLGSGVGTAVIACAMVFNIKKSCGIELFTELHETALLLQQKLLITPMYHDVAHKMVFIQGNFLNNTFHEATLIFINATSFFGDTWIALNQQLENMPLETQVITTSKPLTAPSYYQLNQTKVRMSWGVVNAYIYKKII